MEKQNFNPSTSLQLGLVLPLLTLLLTVLKLNGIIDWSWWIVFSPMIFHATGILFILFAIGLTSLAAILYFTGVATKRFSEYLKEKSNV
jgi:hypothetical protein